MYAKLKTALYKRKCEYHVKYFNEEYFSLHNLRITMTRIVLFQSIILKIRARFEDIRTHSSAHSDVFLEAVYYTLCWLENEISKSISNHVSIRYENKLVHTHDIRFELITGQSQGPWAHVQIPKIDDSSHDHFKIADENQNCRREPKLPYSSLIKTPEYVYMRTVIYARDTWS